MLGYNAIYQTFAKTSCIEPARCMQEVQSVEIDQSGTYKYVLVRVQSRQSRHCSKLLVRGRQTAGYHRDIVQAEQRLLANEQVEVSLLRAQCKVMHAIVSLLTMLMQPATALPYLSLQVWV